MPLTSACLRLSLLLCAIGMALMAVFFLRERCLSLGGYLAWGLLALLLPYLGPFLVILSCPGVPLHPHRRLTLHPRFIPVLQILNRARDGFRKWMQPDQIHHRIFGKSTDL